MATGSTDMATSQVALGLARLGLAQASQCCASAQCQPTGTQGKWGEGVRAQLLFCTVFGGGLDIDFA